MISPQIADLEADGLTRQTAFFDIRRLGVIAGNVEVEVPRLTVIGLGRSLPVRDSAAPGADQCPIRNTGTIDLDGAVRAEWQRRGSCQCGGSNYEGSCQTEHRGS